MNPSTGQIKQTVNEAAAIDPNFLPEATDDLITEYRNKFRVMTNMVGQGCLVFPRGRFDWDKGNYYLLSESQSLQITNMIRILLKRVDGDKAIIGNLSTLNLAHENQIRDLEVRVKTSREKVDSMDEKFRKMLERLSTLQSEVDNLRNQKHDDDGKSANDGIIEETSEAQTIELLETQLREAKERNLALHKKITKMACIQAEMSNGIDPHQHQAVVRENQELASRNKFLESKINEVYSAVAQGTCSPTCQSTKKHLEAALLKIDQLEEQNQDLKAQNLALEMVSQAEAHHSAKQLKEAKCSKCESRKALVRDLHTKAEQLEVETNRLQGGLIAMQSESRTCRNCAGLNEDLLMHIGNCIKLEHSNKKLSEANGKFEKEHDELKQDYCHLQSKYDKLLAEARTCAKSQEIDHLKFFVKVLVGIYPEVDIYYVREIIKQLLLKE